MFSIRLKELREKNNLSQQAFAIKMNISQSTIGMWESGKREPNFSTIQKLADYFNVSVDYLLGRTEEITATNETISELNIKEEEILEIFRKLNEEKQNKVIGYAEAQLNDDDNIYYIGYNAAMGGERTATRHTKEDTKKLIDAFEAEFEKDVPPIE